MKKYAVHYNRCSSPCSVNVYGKEELLAKLDTLLSDVDVWGILVCEYPEL